MLMTLLADSPEGWQHLFDSVTSVCDIYVLLYGVEGWTLTDGSCRKITTFDKWWNNTIILEVEVEKINRIGRQPKLLKADKAIKLEYFGPTLLEIVHITG